MTRCKPEIGQIKQEQGHLVRFTGPKWTHAEPVCGFCKAPITLPDGWKCRGTELLCKACGDNPNPYGEK